MFSLIFAGVILYTGFKIKRTSPIDLIKGSKKGEKEPEANYLLGILGIACLGIGYYIALTIKNVLLALPSFFIAVILVVIGTYLLFTWGSIIIIKLLKKNKNFYYRKKNFVAVSNMLYRMKKNAIGLANIAILSTAVLLILSSTISLYLGLEGMLDRTFPKDVFTNYVYEGQSTKKIERVIKDQARENKVKVEDSLKYYSFEIDGFIEGEDIIVNQSIEEENFLSFVESYGSLKEIRMFTLKDYNRLHNKDLELKDREVYLNSDDLDFKHSSINIMGESYKVKDRLEDLNISSFYTEDLDRLNIVVKDLKELKHLETLANRVQDKQFSYYVYEINYNYYFNLQGSRQDKIAFNQELREALNEAIPRVSIVQDRYSRRQDNLSIYGSLFFIGIFLGTLFIIATVLIIYYKQVTEGYEDRERFKILQEVGMSKKEIKNTIKSQVLLIFSIPLITAIVHVSMAFPLVDKMLYLMDLNNTKLFLILTVAIIAIFTVAYVIVYRWTARVYYKIVE